MGVLYAQCTYCMSRACCCCCGLFLFLQRALAPFVIVVHVKGECRVGSQVGIGLNPRCSCYIVGSGSMVLNVFLFCPGWFTSSIPFTALWTSNLRPFTMWRSDVCKCNETELGPWFEFVTFGAQLTKKTQLWYFSFHYLSATVFDLLFNCEFMGLMIKTHLIRFT
jgi:hypothetical protein